MAPTSHASNDDEEEYYYEGELDEESGDSWELVKIPPEARLPDSISVSITLGQFKSTPLSGMHLVPSSFQIGMPSPPNVFGSQELSSVHASPIGPHGQGLSGFSVGATGQLGQLPAYTSGPAIETAVPCWSEVKSYEPPPAPILDETKLNEKWETWIQLTQTQIPNKTRGNQFDISVHRTGGLITNVSGVLNLLSALGDVGKWSSADVTDLYHLGSSQSNCEGFSLFKEGVEPKWEHPRNARGGHYEKRVEERWATCVTSFVPVLIILMTSSPAEIDKKGVINGIRVLRKARTSLKIELWVSSRDDCILGFINEQMNKIGEQPHKFINANTFDWKSHQKRDKA